MTERLPKQLAQIQTMAHQICDQLDQIHQPFFIAQGGADEMIDPVSGLQLKARLQANGVLSSAPANPESVLAFFPISKSIRLIA